MVVSVEFEKNGIEYKIERARRPNFLKFYVNGEEKEDQEQQGDSRETQKDIEKLIGFSHNMFKHIVALNTYTEPFLGMKANDQRAMIEQLLGITELSEKAEILKVRLKDTRDTIKEEEIRINAVKDSNSRVEKSIKDIESRSKAWQKNSNDKIANFETAIATLQEIDIDTELESHTILSEINEKSNLKKQLKKDLDASVSSLKRSDNRIQELKVNIEKAKEGVCPACEQSTAHLDTHEEYTKDLESKLATEQEHFKELDENIETITKDIEDVGDISEEPEVFYRTKEEAIAHQNNLNNIAQQLKDAVALENPYIEQIKTLQETGLQPISWETVNELNELREHQDFLYKLLTSKDSFIRRRIIDQNLMFLNHRLANYLERIGLPHDVKFKSDLSVEITEFGRDLDFDNLSRGERNRLILSLSWAFRDIYESLNQPMNFLCIDELIDSGLDGVGVENALSILKKMSREQNKNIYLISHREELQGRVNNVLTVIKEGGFTSYNTDTEYVN
jgi:DNA repair exonuclease SbcCD ATPase subunit